MTSLETCIREAVEKGGKRDYMRRPQRWIESATLLDTFYIEIVSKGKVYTCYVDRMYVPLVAPYRWYLKAGYAVTSIAGKRIKLHHCIVGARQGKETDHINRNRLDNRFKNLRRISFADNRKNQEGKGYRRRGMGWEAYIGLNGKQKSLGTWATESLAQKAYKNALKERLNSIAV